MTFQIRQLSTADYPFVISVIDQWWGGPACPGPPSGQWVEWLRPEPL
jgi:hypothetical protein